MGLIDVEEAARLHREALKQSATDPLTGRIDVSILTTGQSSAGRKRRAEVATALKDLLLKKKKTPTIGYDKLFNDFRSNSDTDYQRHVRGCLEGLAGRECPRHGREEHHQDKPDRCSVSRNFTSVRFYSKLLSV